MTVALCAKIRHSLLVLFLCAPGFALEGCVARTDTGQTPLAGSDLEALPDAIVANGNDKAVLRARLLDGAGSPQAGARVTFFASGKADIAQPTEPTDASGRVSATISGLTPGRVSVGFEATIDGRLIRGPKTVPLVLLSPATHRLALEVVPQVASVDEALTRQLRVRALSVVDGSGVPNIAVRLTSDRLADRIEPSAGQTDAQGLFSAQMTSTLAGGLHVTVVGDDQQSSVAPATVFAGAPDAAHTYILTRSGTEVAADGVTATQAQVIVADRFDNPVPFAPVFIISNGGNIALIPPRGTADASGVFYTTVVTSELGNTTLSADVGSTAVMQNVVRVAGPASAATSSLVINPNVEPANGQSAAIASVILLDAVGHPRAGDTVVWASSPANLALSPNVSVTDESGLATTQFTSLTVGTFGVSAQTSNVILSQPVTFVAGPPVALESTISVSPSHLVAGASLGSAVQVTLRDAYGHPLAQIPLRWSATDATAQLTPNSGVTDAHGQATSQLLATASGNLRVFARFGSSSLGAEVQILAGSADASKTSLTSTTATTVANGSDKASLTLVVRDSFGNPVPQQSVAFTTDANVSLSGTALTTDSAGRAMITASSVVAGTHQVVANLPGASVFLPLNFVAGAPNAVLSRLVANPSSAVADGQASVSITTTLKDAFGNFCPAQPVFFTNSQPGDAIRPASGVSDSLGSLGAQLSGTSAGERVLSVRSGAMTLVLSVTLVAGPPVASASSWTLSPSTLVADGNVTTSAVLLARDAFGNPTGHLPVTLTSSLDAQGASRFFIQGVSSTNGQTDANGRFVAQWAVTIAGSAQINANFGSQSLTANLLSQPGPASALTTSLTLTPTNTMAGVPQTVEVIARDAFSNRVPAAAVTLSASDANASLGATHFVADDVGRVVTPVTLRQAGQVLVTAQIDTSQGSSFAVMQNTQVSAGAPVIASSSFVASPNGVVADGVASVVLSATVRDAWGNPVPSFRMDFSSGQPGDVFSPGTAWTDAAGRTSTQWSGTFASQRSATAQIGNQQLSASALFVPGALDGGASTFVISPNVFVADGSQAAMVNFVARDVFHNVLPTLPVTLKAANQNITLAQGGGQTDSMGRYQDAVSTKRAQADLLTLTAGGANFTAPFVALPGAAAAATSTLGVTPNQLIADNQSQAVATLVLSDAYGNRIPHAVVSWTVGDATLSSATTQTDSNGIATASLMSARSGLKTLRAVASGLNFAGSVRFVPGLPVAAQSVLTPSTTSAPANGVGQIGFVLQLRDAQNNPTPQVAVVFSTTAANTNFTVVSGNTDSAGEFVTQMSATAPGQCPVTASFFGSEGNTTVTAFANFVALDANNTLFDLSITPNTLVADGVSSSVVKAHLTDGLGTPVPNQQVTFTGLGTGDVLNPYGGLTDANGLWTGGLQSTWARRWVLSASAANITSIQPVQVVSGPPSQTSSSFVVGPNQLIADGQAHSLLNLLIQDGFGNPVVGQSVVLSADRADVALSVQSGVTDGQGRFLSTAASTSSGPSTLTATAGSLALVQNIQFVAGSTSATQSSAAASPNVAVANGAQSVVILAAARDAFNNPRPHVSFTVVQPSGASVMGLPASGTLDANGHLTLPLQSTVAMPLSLTIQLDGVPLAVPIAFVPGEPNQAQTTFLGASQSVTANGNDQAVLSFVLRDAFSNAIPNASVTFGSLDGNTIFHPALGLTDNQGRVAVTASSVRAGSAALTATANTTVFNTQTLFGAGPATTAQSTLTVQGAPATANSSSAVTLTFLARDAFGNPAGSQPISVNATQGQVVFKDAASGLQNGGSLSGTTDASGQWLVQATSTVAEAKAIVFQVGQASLTQSLNFVAGPPDANLSLLRVLPAQTTADGQSQATLVLTARDAFNNAASAVAVTFAVDGQSNALAPTVAATNASGSAVASLSSTTAEQKTVSATLGGITLSASAIFVAGPASNATSSLMLSPQSIVADGATRANVTLLARDMSGNAATGRTATLIGPRLSLNPVSGTTDFQGGWQSTVSGVVAGNVLLSVSVDNIVLTTPLTLVPGPPDPGHSSVVMTPNPVTADANARGTVQVTVADSQGNPIGAAAFILTSQDANDYFGTASGVTNSQGQASTFVSSGVAGSKTLVATIQNVALFGAAVFVPGVADATRSFLSISPNRITADGISQGAISLILRDAHDNLIANGPVSLTAPGATLSTTQGTTNASGRFSAQLTGTQAQSTTLTVVAGPTSISTVAQLVAGAPPPNNSFLSATPSSVTADNNQTITVLLRVADAFGNPVPDQSVTWGATGLQTTVFSATLKTAADGTAIALVKSRKAQNERITAAVAGLGLSTPVTFLPGAASASQSTLVSAPNAVVADGTQQSTLTLTVLDALGNPSPNQAANLLVTGINNNLSTNRWQTGSDGTATATLASTRAETKNILAQLANFNLTNQILFIAGPPTAAQTLFVASPNAAVADGVATITLSLSVRDAYGNPTPNQAVSFAVDGTSSQLGAGTGFSDASGTLTNTLRSTVAQLKNVDASVGGLTKRVTVNFFAGPMSTTTSTLFLSPNHVLADGNSQAEVVLTASDAFGNPIIGQTAQFLSSGGATDSFSNSTALTDSTGTAIADLRSTRAGMRTISASVGQSSICGLLAFFPGPPSSLTSTLTLSPAQVVADGNSYTTLAVVAQDAFGNPVPQQNVIISVSGTAALLGQGQGQTSDTGYFSTQLASTVAENKAVAVSLGSTTLTGNVTFSPGPPVSATSTLTAVPSQNTADGNSSILIALILRDAQGNPVPNRLAALSVSGTRNFLSATGASTDDGGRATFQINSTHAEIKSVIASLTGMSLQTTATFLPGAPVLQSSTLSVNPNVILADALIQPSIGLLVADAQGNPVPAQGANLLSTNVSDILLPVSGSSDGNGLIAASITATQAGIRTVTGNLSGFSVSSDLQVLPGSPNQLRSSVASTPNQITADGASYATITVIIRDTFNNPIPNRTLALSVIGDPISTSPSAPITNASGTAVITARSNLATARTLTLADNNVLLTVPLRFVPGPVSNTTSRLTLTPPCTVADGNSAIGVTIVLADASNNLISNQSVALSASGASNLFSPGAGVTNASGAFVSTWTSTQAASKTLIADVGTTTLTASARFNPGAPSAITSSLIASPNSVLADGQTIISATVLAQDAFGNPVANQLITWGSTGNSILLSSNQSVTDNTAQSSITLASTLAQRSWVLAQLGNLQLSAPIGFVAGAPNSVQTTFIISPNGPLVADGQQTNALQAQVRDAFGNPVPGVTVALSAGGSGTTLTAPASATNAMGLATGMVASTVAETKTITMTAGPATRTVSASFLAGAPNGLFSSLSLSPNAIVAGNTATLLARFADAFGNPLVAQPVSLTGGQGVGVSGFGGATGSNGNVTATLSATLAQQTSFSATVGNLTLSTPFAVVAAPASTASSTLALSSNTAIANNANTITLAGYAADIYGNPAAGQTVALSTLVPRFVGQRFSNGQQTCVAGLSINGVPVTNYAKLPTTGSPNNWALSPIHPVFLQSGNNALFFSTTGSSENLDAISVSLRDALVLVEAETGVLGGSAQISSVASGFNGAGYVSFAAASNSVLSVNLSPSVINANYFLGVRFSSDAVNSGNVQVFANSSPIGTLSLQGTQSLSTWAHSVVLPVTLLQGNNVIALQGYNPNTICIDQVRLYQRGPSRSFEAEFGALQGNATSQNLFSGFSGTGYVTNLGAANSGVTLNVPVTGDAFTYQTAVDANGFFQSTWQSSVAENKALRVSVGGASLSANAIFVADAPSQATSAVAFGGNGSAVAGLPFAFVAQIQDALGNPTPGVQVTFTSPSPNITFQNTTATTGAFGEVATTAVATQASLQKLCIQVGSSWSQCANLTVGPASPNTQLSYVTITPNTIVAGGNASISVHLVDAYGDPTPGQNVVITGGNAIIFSSISGPSDSMGNITARLQTNIAQSAVIQATVGALNIPSFLQVVPGVASQANTSLTVGASPVVADNTAYQLISGHVADAFGNPIANQTVNLGALLSRSVSQRFANGGPNSSTGAVITINGISRTDCLLGYKTNGWSRWYEAPLCTVALMAGNNTIFQGRNSNPPNVDFLDVSYGDQIQTFEAENATLAGAAAVATSQAGFFGSGYVQMAFNTNAQLTSSFFFDSANTNTFLVLRYSSANSFGLNPTLNGNSLGSQLYNYNSQWKNSLLIPIQPQEGNNTLSLAFVGTNDPNYTFAIDQIMILQRGPTFVVQAEAGTLAGSAYTDTTYSGYTGTGYVTGLSGAGNTLTTQLLLSSETWSPQNPSTDANGNFTSRWSSIIAEPKTLTMTTGGVSLQGNTTFSSGVPSLSRSLPPSLSSVQPVVGAPFVMGVQALDAYGNPVPGLAASYTSSSPNVTFLGNSGTSSTYGSAYTTASSTLASSQQICAQLGSSFVQCSNITFVPAAPSVGLSTFSVTPNTTSAGSPLSLKATLLDAYGNFVSGQNVLFSGVRSPNTQANIGAGAPLPTNANGLVTTTYTPTVSGTYVFSANASLFSLQANVVVYAANANVALSSLVKSPLGDQNAEGNYTVTLTLRDAYNNLCAGQNYALSVIANPNIAELVSAGFVDGNGRVVLYSPSPLSLAAQRSITATIPAGILTQNFNVIAASPNATLSSLVANPNAGIVADTNASLTLNAVFVDRFGNPVTGQTVSWQTTGANVTFSPNFVNTNQLGQAATIVTSNVAQTIALSAGMANIKLSTPVVFVPGPPDANFFHLSVTPNTMVAGQGVELVTAVIADRYNNVIVNQNVLFESFYSNYILAQSFTRITDANGFVSSLTNIQPLYAGLRPVRLTAAAAALTGFYNVLPAAASAPNSSLTLSPNTSAVVSNNLGIMATLIAKDKYDNADPNHAVMWFASGVNVTLSSNTTNTDTGGKSVIYFGSTKAQNLTLNANVDGAVLSANMVFQVASPNAAMSSFSFGALMGSPNGRIAMGNIVVRDAYSNPIPNLSLNFSVTDLNGTLTPYTVATSPIGMATTSLVSVYPGNHQVCAQDGNGFALCSNVLYPQLNPNSALSVMSLSSNSLVVGATAQFTAYLKDDYGAPIAQQNVNLVAQVNRFIGQRYGAGNGSARNSQIYINGVIGQNYVSFPALGPLVSSSWDNWALSPVYPLTLLSGNNTLQFINSGSPTNIDSVTVSLRDTNQVFEAENGVLSNGATAASSLGGYVGSGYAYLPPRSNATVTIPFSVSPLNSNVYCMLRYSAGADANVLLSLNPGGGNTVFLAATDSLTDWRPSVVIPLVANQGNNTLSLTALDNNFQLDQVFFIQRGSSQLFEAETGQVAGGAAVATDHPGYTGTGFVGYLDSSSKSLTLTIPVTSEVFSTSAGQTDANGFFVSSWGSSVSEAKVFTASAGNLSFTTKVLFAPGSPNITKSSFAVSATNITAGGNVAVVLNLQDAVANPIANAGTSVSGGTNVIVSTAFPPTNIFGTTSGTLQTNQAQNTIINITSGGLTFFFPLVVTPGSPNAIVSGFRSLGSNGIADGTTAFQITGVIADRYGNGVPSLSVNLSSSGLRFLSMRHASNQNLNSPTSILINGKLQSSWTLLPTTSLSDWEESDVQPVYLQQGNNTVSLVQLGGPQSNWDTLYLKTSNANWVIQAESGVSTGGAYTTAADANYTGTGYVNFNNTVGAAVSYTVFATPGDQNRNVTLRYESTADNPNYILSVNGNNMRYVPLKATAANGSWYISPPMPITLQPGNNLIAVSNANPSMNLDYLVLTEIPSDTRPIEVESGAVYGGAAVSSSVSGYSGAGYVDLQNNSNAGVYLTVNNPVDTWNATSVVTDANGGFLSSFRSTRAENKWVVASYSGLTTGQNVLFVAAAPVSGASFIQPGSSQAIAGITLPMGVKAQDNNGNPAAGVKVILTTSLGQSALTPNVVTLDSRGFGLASFYGTLTGTTQVCGQFNGLFTSCATFNVVAGAPNALLSVVSGTPSSAVAGANVALQLLSKDDFGNACSGLYSGVTFYVPGGGATDNFGYADSNGIVAVTYATRVAGNYNLVGYPQNIKSSFSVSPNNPAKIVASGFRTVPAGHINDVNLVVYDMYNNIATSYTGQTTVSSDDGLTVPISRNFSGADAGAYFGTGVLTQYAPGLRTISVSGNNITGFSTNVLVMQPIVAPVKFKQAGISPNMCLQAANLSAVSGQNIVIARCSSHLSQVFGIGSDKTLRAGNRCLTLGAPYQTGTTVRLQNCNAVVGQQWGVSGARVTSMANTNICLGAVTAGSTPQIGAISCASGNADIFASEKRSGVFNITSSYWNTMSWTAGGPNLSGSDYNRITHQGYSGNFGVSLNANDQLLLSPNICLDLVGQTVQSGANVTAYPCQGNVLSQKWFFQGTNLSPVSNASLCVQRSTDNIGAPFLLAACTTADNQKHMPVEYGLFTNLAAVNYYNNQVCLSMNTTTPSSGSPDSNNTLLYKPCQHNILQTINPIPWPYGSNSYITREFGLYGNGNWVLDLSGLQSVFVFPSSSGASGQRWLDEGRGGVGYLVVNLSGYSYNLDSNNVSYEPTAVLQSQNDSASTQYWYHDILPTSWSPNASSGQCFSVSNVNFALGQPVVLAACSSNSNQQFIVSQTQVSGPRPFVSTVVFDGLCLDSSAGLTGGGIGQLNLCSGAASQMWTIPTSNAPFKNGAGYCLDTTTPGNPNTLGVNTCSGIQSQSFNLVVK